LAALQSLDALKQAASGISTGDLAVLKALPAPADSTNLISVITGFSDNVLSLPGSVSGLKASAAALALKSLGLSVPGFS
jgi:hypothetical protein